MRCTCLILMLATAMPAPGQEADVRPDFYRAETWLAAGVLRPDPAGRVIRGQETPPPTSPVLIGLGSAAGWGAGVLGDGFIGFYTLDKGTEAWIPVGTMLGALVGGILGAPFGAHLANRRRGPFGAALLTSAGVQALTIGLAAALENSEVLWATPVLQVGFSTAIEYRSSR